VRSWECEVPSTISWIGREPVVGTDVTCAGGVPRASVEDAAGTPGSCEGTVGRLNRGKGRALGRDAVFSSEGWAFSRGSNLLGLSG